MNPQIYYMIELDDVECTASNDFNKDDSFFSVDYNGIAHSYSTLWVPNCPYDIGELIDAIMSENSAFGNDKVAELFGTDV